MRGIVATMNETLQTPFGFSSTADEVLAGVDLSGTRALVTHAVSLDEVATGFRYFGDRPRRPRQMRRDAVAVT
jgi:hypothetical protein